MSAKRIAKAPSASKIGRGRRSQRTYFPKGVSGNPKGRPKGSKNLSTLMMEAARQKISVEIDGKSRKITAIQATVLQLVTKAARGDPKAAAAFLDAIEEIERRTEAARPPEFSLCERDVEVLRAAHARMLLCDRDIPGE